MATSGITANFAVRDPAEVQRFVAALLSTDRPVFKFVSGVDNLRRQIERATI